MASMGHKEDFGSDDRIPAMHHSKRTAHGEELRTRLASMNSFMMVGVSSCSSWNHESGWASVHKGGVPQPRPDCKT